MPNKFKALIITGSILSAMLIVVGVLLAAGWIGKSLPAKGTINITTTTPAQDFNYTLSPAEADFGATTFASGSLVSISFQITVNNTGNQNINGFGIAPTNLPMWLSAAITQTPITAGNSGPETITVSGTAPLSPSTVTFDSNVSFLITPNK